MLHFAEELVDGQMLSPATEVLTTSDGNRRNRRRMIVAVSGVILVSVLGWSWVKFNEIPTEQDLRSIFDDASQVNVAQVSDGKIVRVAELTDPKRCAALGEVIRFNARFWRFSTEPRNAIVVEVLGGDSRNILDVRADDCIHIRKAVRWYRMPAGPELRAQLSRLVEAHGRKMADDASAVGGGSLPEAGEQ